MLVVLAGRVVLAAEECPPHTARDAVVIPRIPCRDEFFARSWHETDPFDPEAG